jgi:hypothetical protein
MTIKTASGSTYSILVKNGKVYFQKGLTEGVVVALDGLKIGESLTIKYHPLNIHSQEQKSVAMIHTTKITSIY